MRTDPTYWYVWAKQFYVLYHEADDIGRKAELLDAQVRCLEFQLHFSPINSYDISQGRYYK